MRKRRNFKEYYKSSECSTINKASDRRLKLSKKKIAQGKDIEERLRPLPISKTSPPFLKISEPPIFKVKFSSSLNFIAESNLAHTAQP